MPAFAITRLVDDQHAPAVGLQGGMGAPEGQSPLVERRRIPGSVNVPWGGLIDPDTNRFRPAAEIADQLQAAGVADAPSVIAYCGGGISATVDLFALSLIGRDDARLYDGSLTEWTARPELPVETG